MTRMLLSILSPALPCLLLISGGPWDRPVAAQSPTTNSRVRSVLAPGAKLVSLADGFAFTEGPAVDHAGNVYFTDQPNDRIHRWSTDGELSEFLSPAGRSNGLFFSPDGALIACADGKNELWAIAPDGSHHVLLSGFDNKLLNGPNDCWVDQDGTIFFTDPYYKRPYWKRGPSEQDGQCVYRLAPSEKRAVRVADSFQQPNGIIGDVAKRQLFVADIRASKTYVFRVNASQHLVDRKLFCPQGSDGMTIDSDRNIYLTGREGVTVWNAVGEKVEVISVPEKWTANVTIGGAEGRTLFITASQGLYSIELATSRLDRF